MKVKTTIVRTSPFSGKVNRMEMTVDPGDIAKWKQGELLQVALPYLTADEREFLKTGITPQEWEDTFGA